MSKSKKIKIVIICLVFAALLAGLITMMVLPQDYGKPDKLDIGASNFGQRLLIGLQVALLGLGTVFIMLFLLIFMVTLMRMIFEGVGEMKAKHAEKKAQVPTQEVAVVENSASEEDEEVVAVIMAALNAYYDAQNETYKSNLKFRVRSIKEI